jgi:PAS domain-containing protein
MVDPTTASLLAAWTLTGLIALLGFIWQCGVRYPRAFAALLDYQAEAAAGHLRDHEIAVTEDELTAIRWRALMKVGMGAFVVARLTVLGERWPPVVVAHWWEWTIYTTTVTVPLLWDLHLYWRQRQRH